MPYHDTENGEMPACVEELKRAINDTGAVYNVTETYGRVTIDFSTVDGDPAELITKAQGGTYGSSLVVDTTNAEVVAGTLRLGDLELPVGADLFMAKTSVEQVLNDTNPPTTTSSIDDDAGLYVRMRDMAAMRGDFLDNEGDDILHIEVNRRVDIKEFTEWYLRFRRVYDRRKPEIQQRVRELGADDPNASAVDAQSEGDGGGRTFRGP